MSVIAESQAQQQDIESDVQQLLPSSNVRSKLSLQLLLVPLLFLGFVVVSVVGAVAAIRSYEVVIGRHALLHHHHRNTRVNDTSHMKTGIQSISYESYPLLPTFNHDLSNQWHQYWWDWATKPSPPFGYCRTSLSSLDSTTNHDICPAGSSKDVQKRIQVTFFEESETEIEWQFIVKLDAGLGYIVMIDTDLQLEKELGRVQNDVWGSTENPIVWKVHVKQGTHVFVVYALEDCCDGHAGAWLVSRAGEPFHSIQAKAQ